MFKRFLKVNLGFAALFLGMNLMSLTPAHAAYNTNTNTNTNNSYSTEVTSDQNIARKIKDKLGSGWFTKGFDHVTVQVTNGDVTLQGFVKTMSDKEKVEKEVRNVEGVRRISNLIAIQESSEPSHSYNRNSSTTTDRNSYNTTATIPDQELAAKIRDKISSGWFSRGFDRVIVRVNNGDVNLQGTVKTFDEKDKVEVEVRKVTGVRSINNQIAVEDLNAPRTSNGNFKAIPDQELAEKIRDKISSGWFSKGYDQVIVQVNSGNVVLLGTVKSMDDKEKVEKEVRKIDGVKHLNNQISVQEHPQY